MSVPAMHTAAWPAVTGCDHAVARAVPQVLRIALAYSLLDDRYEGPVTIRVEHLKAALAVWDYVEASARFVFGDVAASRDLTKLSHAIDQAGSAGLTRSDVVDLFGRNKPRNELDELLRQLMQIGRYEQMTETSGGRPVTRFRRNERNEKNEVLTEVVSGDTRLAPVNSDSSFTSSAVHSDAATLGVEDAQRRKHVGTR